MRDLCGQMIVAVGIFVAPLAMAVEVAKDRRIPDEYETGGGHTLGFGNAGIAAAGGVSAVRLNPAMLPMEKNYAVGGGYNWPTFGREFYQVGIIDTTTASFGAGFLYNGFTEKYISDVESNEISNPAKKDSTVKQRFAVGIGKTMQKISVGVNVQYLEAGYMEAPDNAPEGVEYYNSRQEKGTTFGAGIAGLLTPNLRFGISGENIANSKVTEFAPRIYRAGLAFLMNGDVSVHVDLRQRDRVNSHEIAKADPDFSLAAEENAADAEYAKPERMAIVSGSARVYDMLRLIAGYGQAVEGPERRSVSGGAVLVNGDMSFSYTFSRPYMSYKESQQAFNLSMAINL